MLMILRWRPIQNVDDRIIMLATFSVMFVIFSMYEIGHQYLKLVTITICLQHPSPSLMSQVFHLQKVTLPNVTITVVGETLTVQTLAVF